MSEGYMALCVSILKGVPPEQAFRLLAGKCTEETAHRAYRRWGRTEKSLMRAMHEAGDTWEGIGRKFGISGCHARALAMHGAGTAGQAWNYRTAQKTGAGCMKILTTLAMQKWRGSARQRESMSLIRSLTGMMGTYGNLYGDMKFHIANCTTRDTSGWGA